MEYQNRKGEAQEAPVNSVVNSYETSLQNEGQHVGIRNMAAEVTSSEHLNCEHIAMDMHSSSNEEQDHSADESQMDETSTVTSLNSGYMSNQDKEHKGNMDIIPVDNIPLKNLEHTIIEKVSANNSSKNQVNCDDTIQVREAPVIRSIPENVKSMSERSEEQHMDITDMCEESMPLHSCKLTDESDQSDLSTSGSPRVSSTKTGDFPKAEYNVDLQNQIKEVPVTNPETTCQQNNDKNDAKHTVEDCVSLENLDYEGRNRETELHSADAQATAYYKQQTETVSDGSNCSTLQNHNIMTEQGNEQNIIAENVSSKNTILTDEADNLLKSVTKSGNSFKARCNADDIHQIKEASVTNPETTFQQNDVKNKTKHTVTVEDCVSLENLDYKGSDKETLENHNDTISEPSKEQNRIIVENVSSENSKLTDKADNVDTSTQINLQNSVTKSGNSTQALPNADVKHQIEEASVTNPYSTFQQNNKDKAIDTVEDCVSLENWNHKGDREATFPLTEEQSMSYNKQQTESNSNLENPDIMTVMSEEHNVHVDNSDLTDEADRTDMSCQKDLLDSFTKSGNSNTAHGNADIMTDLDNTFPDTSQQNTKANTVKNIVEDSDSFQNMGSESSERETDDDFVKTQPMAYNKQQTMSASDVSSSSENPDMMSGQSEEHNMVIENMSLENYKLTDEDDHSDISTQKDLLDSFTTAQSNAKNQIEETSTISSNVSLKNEEQPVNNDITPIEMIPLQNMDYQNTLKETDSVVCQVQYMAGDEHQLGQTRVTSSGYTGSDETPGQARQPLDDAENMSLQGEYHHTDNNIDTPVSVQRSLLDTFTQTSKPADKESNKSEQTDTTGIMDIHNKSKRLSIISQTHQKQFNLHDAHESISDTDASDKVQNFMKQRTKRDTKHSSERQTGKNERHSKIQKKHKLIICDISDLAGVYLTKADHRTDSKSIAPNYTKAQQKTKSKSVQNSGEKNDTTITGKVHLTVDQYAATASKVRDVSGFASKDSQHHTHPRRIQQKEKLTLPKITQSKTVKMPEITESKTVQTCSSTACAPGNKRVSFRGMSEQTDTLILPDINLSQLNKNYSQEQNNNLEDAMVSYDGPVRPLYRDSSSASLKQSQTHALGKSSAQSPGLLYFYKKGCKQFNLHTKC